MADHYLKGSSELKTVKIASYLKIGPIASAPKYRFSLKYSFTQGLATCVIRLLSSTHQNWSSG